MRPMDIRTFQNIIRETYSHHDERRGLDKTLEWFLTEVYEFIEAVNGEGDVESEAADVFAWLVSVLNLLGIDLEEAVRRRYGGGCPKCGSKPCSCGYRDEPNKKVLVVVRTQS